MREESNPQRIAKILSAHGVSSRREAERMIVDGRITVNGIPAEIGQCAEHGRDEIAIDGVPLPSKEDFVYIMLNKPSGFLTTVKDERGRKTVMSLVADVGMRVYPVGRLDLDSEGLLLLTNDGQFANEVAHPSFNKIKTYEVHVFGDAQNALEQMRRPMEIDSHVIKAASVKLSKQTKQGGIILISINEGRNRQIRKMCTQCGLNVRSLRRVSVGPLSLGSLKTGKWRHLTEDELVSLRGT